MSEQEFKKARRLKKHGAILAMKRDTFHSSPRSWFHFGHDGKIHVVNQRSGESATGQVSLTRAEFERFVRFYERGVKALNEQTVSG